MRQKPLRQPAHPRNRALRAAALALLACLPGGARAQSYNLFNFTIVTDDPKQTALAERIAPTVLAEEIQRRTGGEFKILTEWPDAAPAVIAIATRDRLEQWLVKPDETTMSALIKLPDEGYIIHLDTTTRQQPTLWILGADARGALFGVGRLLRMATLRAGDASIVFPCEAKSAPAYPLRGHQLGFRNRANSWDAWTVEQFDQYIRELALFGTNAIENIPFQDDDPMPLAKVARDEMNKKMGEICEKYGLEYWAWTPADFDLKDEAKRKAELERHEKFYGETPRLDGVFFPGGDPGDNPADLVMKFLEDVAKPLGAKQPKAKIWLSMQSFSKQDQDYVYKYLDEKKPEWFGGIVCGPSSPSIEGTRQRLDPRYKLRAYPDLTHTVRCQYPVPGWDRAFALTLGRECVNYRPADMKRLHNFYAPYTDGFISYSDGVHDDLNKIVWSMAAWDPDFDLVEGLREYARLFMDYGQSERMASGMLALENNWRAPAVENGAVDGTFFLWRDIDQSIPDDVRLKWRYQMAIFRAGYDSYQRRRQIHESAVQRDADAVLRRAEEIGSAKAIEGARAEFGRADEWEGSDLRPIIEALGDQLFQSIQLQTSVPKYGASGSERGCSIDFLRAPLNNRAYYEYSFPLIEKLGSEAEKVAALRSLATWESPGAGGFYDDVGYAPKSPHMVAAEGVNTDPEMVRNPNVDFAWANGGDDIRRPAWLDWVEALAFRYEGLDPVAGYRVRATMRKGDEAKLLANGAAAEPLPDPPTPPTPPSAGKFGYPIAMKEWRIPKGAIGGDRILELKWEQQGPSGRVYHPALAEVWVIRENP